MESNYSIYKITYPNKKLYIGSSKNFDKRKAQHKSDSTHRKLKDKQICDRAIAKYGWDNIIINIICTVPPEYIDDAEKYFIALYKSNDKNLGYNIQAGGQKYQRHHTKETCKKISIALSGENNPFYGHKHTEHAKQLMKLSKSNISEETREKQRLYALNRPQEHNNKISLSKSNPNDEIRKKYSESKKGKDNYNYGKHLKKETCDKISIANSKLTYEQKIDILNIYFKNIDNDPKIVKNLAKKYNISVNPIYRLIKKYKFENNISNLKLTASQIDDIIYLYNNKIKKVKDIAKLFNISLSTLYRYINRKK